MSAPAPLLPEDEPAAARVLAHAFRDNPGMIALLNSDDASRRLSLLMRLAPILVANYRKHGDCFVVRSEAGAIAGVALTLPPGRYPPTLALQTQLTLQVALRMPPVMALRLGVADQLLRRYHLRGTPHHYLFMLGVDPEQQGRGHGSVLLRELSRRADEARVPCYLETDKPSSVRLYERHGYAVTRQASFARLGKLALWFMQRPAT